MSTQQSAYNRPIADEHLEEARKLSALYKQRKASGWLADRGISSQAVFGEQHDIGNQAAVWQFLNGRSPLSLKAAIGFANGLEVSIADFSPRLAAKVKDITERGGGTGDGPRNPAMSEAVETLSPRQLLTQLAAWIASIPEGRRDSVGDLLRLWVRDGAADGYIDLIDAHLTKNSESQARVSRRSASAPSEPRHPPQEGAAGQDAEELATLLQRHIDEQGLEPVRSTLASRREIAAEEGQKNNKRRAAAVKHPAKGDRSAK